MKLGPLVYENKWKSKSHTFPFNGTISLKLGSLYKKKLKRLKMKIWPHFHSKKAFSYWRFCKRNIFLMHGFGNMNFLSFSILLGTDVLAQKSILTKIFFQIKYVNLDVGFITWQQFVCNLNVQSTMREGVLEYLNFHSWWVAWEENQDGRTKNLQ